ncbi:MAG: NADH-quinone oxidoreductase subunit M [Deltaproteobacteria bacterium]|nr:NADH-quinone oxidoreductase subunit M [Deltaproteobacteria bacterium]
MILEAVKPGHFPIVASLICIPLIGVMGLILAGRERVRLMKGIALFATVSEAAFSLLLVSNFDAENGEMQFVEAHTWVSELGVSYQAGIDGLNLWLVVLSALLLMVLVISTGSVGNHQCRKTYFIRLLLLESAAIGAFVATDVFLFYVFWETALIPAYFLMGWEGNSSRRSAAATKCVLYNMAGGLFLLGGIVYLYFYYHSITGEYSCNLLHWYTMIIPGEVQPWLFLTFTIAFAVRIPLFPFHTWLPNAYTEASVGGRVVLGSIFLGMGCYGLLRFTLLLFPQAVTQYGHVVAFLAVFSLLYGGLVAVSQDDINRLLAYASVSSLGFAVLGICSGTVLGITGGVLQVINHGVVMAALFLMLDMLDRRCFTGTVGGSRGLWKTMPVFAFVFLIVCCGWMGVPGLSGFISVFLILLGGFRTNVWYVVFGAGGLVLVAIYGFGVLQRVFFGQGLDRKDRDGEDLSNREQCALLPIVILVFWIGLYPMTFVQPVETTVREMMQRVELKIKSASDSKAGDVGVPEAE